MVDIGVGQGAQSSEEIVGAGSVDSLPFSPSPDPKDSPKPRAASITQTLPVELPQTFAPLDLLPCCLGDVRSVLALLLLLRETALSYGLEPVTQLYGMPVRVHWASKVVDAVLPAFRVLPGVVVFSWMEVRKCGGHSLLVVW